MSGPKVVRIVTREEILEICRGHMARVDAALAEWTRVGRRNDCIDEEALATAGRRRDALAALITAERFMDLQKQAANEEAFLRDDIQVRLAAVAAAQAQARQRDRRERDAAATLLRTLKASRHAVDPALEAGLERGAPDALARGFQLMAERNSGASIANLGAAARLQGSEPERTLADWIATQPASEPDPAVERIEARLVELAAHASDDATQTWRARLDEAEDASPARRALLLDGLEVETGRALTGARSRRKALAELLATLAELGAAGLDGAAHERDLAALDETGITDRTAAARATLDGHRALRAAEARRAAVLEGLAGLGYEVSEGMSTTWVDNGRLVLRNATRPDYGVEVSGAGDGGRLQMRAVAFDAGGRGPDPSRDRDAETIWCGDVSGLEERLARIGGGLVIERALPVGATPLKRIAVEASPDAGGAAAAPAPRQRSLR